MYRSRRWLEQSIAFTYEDADGSRALFPLRDDDWDEQWTAITLTEKGRRRMHSEEQGKCLGLKMSSWSRALSIVVLF